MGMFGISRHPDYPDMAGRMVSLQRELDEIKDSAPDPSNWNLVDRVDWQPYCLLKIQYPNVKIHSGIKILLFKARFDDIIKQKKIDPHFSDEKGEKLIYPMIRFAPNEWETAKEITKWLQKRLSNSLT